MLKAGFDPNYPDFDAYGENYGPYEYFGERSIYYGQFSKGYRHGLGLLIFHDGDIYEGHFENDQINGHGARINGENFYMEG